MICEKCKAQGKTSRVRSAGTRTTLMGGVSYYDESGVHHDHDPNTRMKAKTKTVTRRLGWTFLKPGDFINAVEKCQGLKKGEKVKRLGTIVVRSVKRERLNVLLDEIDYGIEEVKREGLEEHPEVMGSPWSFVDFFCRTHAKCNGDTVVTRIEFEHFSL